MKKFPSLILIAVMLIAIIGCIRFICLVGPILIQVLQSLN